jgi:hypothetical protein
VTPARCDEHGVTLPCSGCRADELAARGEQAAALVAGQGVPPERVAQILRESGVRRDVRAAAAGEREDDDG